MTLTQYMAGTGINLGEMKPVWKDNAHKGEELFIKWFQEHLPKVEEFNKPRIYEMWNNILWYTGDILNLIDNRVRYPDFTGFADKTRKVMPFWIAHLSSLVDRRANDLATLRPDFDCMATNLEENDRVTARVMKVILEHIKRFNEAEILFFNTERTNGMCGEAVGVIDWNENVGDRKAGDPEEREGEVTIREIPPWWLLYWPCRNFMQSKMAFLVHEILHVDEARKKYNKNDIEPDKRDRLYDFASPWAGEVWSEEVTVFRVVYPPDEFLPEGLDVLCTREKVLKLNHKKYPYTHASFPFEVHSDIVVPGRVFPYSVLRYAKPIQHTYNYFSGLIKKAAYHVSHPKWMTVRGGCNIQSLGNAMTVVQHKVGMEPKLVTYPFAQPELFTFRASMKSEMEQIMGSSPLSRGEVPPNTRSGVQISRLQNIEAQGRKSQADKRNDFMRRVLKKAASVAGDKYPQTSKEHVVRIVGRENAIDVVNLKDVKISAEYDITIQNATGFSPDMAGRLEEIGFIRQQLPGLLTPQQELDILGTRNVQKYYDIPTAALRAAEAENEIMNDGREIPGAFKEEDHLQHWITHAIDMQTASHKKLPERIRKMKAEHLATHEMWMEKIAETNMAFKQKLATLDRYPMFFNINQDKLALESQMGTPPPTFELPQGGPPPEGLVAPTPQPPQAAPPPKIGK